MSDDTSQVSLLAGYQLDEAGITAQVSLIAGYQPDEAGLAAQLATLVGYTPPDPPVAVVPDITGTVGTPATFDGSGTTGPADTILSWAWTSVPGGSAIANAPIPLPDNSVSNTLDLSMADNEGLYHFEGDANDSSGNGRNGTVSGAVQTTGKVGSNAYAFAHADSTDVITFGSAGFDFVSADAFSFSMWVKPDASQPGANAVLFGKTNFSTTGYALFQNGGANSNLYSLIVGTGGGLSGTGVNFALTAGTWNHVCVTRSANGAQTRIYVNNVLVTDVSTLTTIASSGGITLGIGNFSAVPQAALAFNGDIDEFCVWSRELTPLEVETVYDYGNGTYAGFGETLTFTQDVAGTYTVEAEANSLWGSDSVTADAVISAADTSKPNVFMWSPTNTVVDSYFFSGSFVAGEED